MVTRLIWVSLRVTLLLDLIRIRTEEKKKREMKRRIVEKCFSISPYSKKIAQNRKRYE